MVMLLLSLSLQKLPLISPPSLLLLKRRRRRTTTSPLLAVEKESDFELDRDKAREALQNLDQQLQTLSQKEITLPPKKRIISSPKLVSEADRVKDMMMREKMPEFSGSYLAYSGFALLALSILYNIVFITIIQPSVDGK